MKISGSIDLTQVASLCPGKTETSIEAMLFSFLLSESDLRLSAISSSSFFFLKVEKALREKIETVSESLRLIFALISACSETTSRCVCVCTERHLRYTSKRLRCRKREMSWAYQGGKNMCEIALLIRDRLISRI